MATPNLEDIIRNCNMIRVLIKSGTGNMVRIKIRAKPMILIFLHPKCNKHRPTSIIQEETYIVKYSPGNSPIQNKAIPKLIGRKPNQDGFEGVDPSSSRAI